MNTELFGLLVQFDEADELIAAAQKTHAEGYTRAEAYSPYPIEELAEALEFRNTGIPKVFLIGGIVGGCTGFGLQYWCSAIAYPINVGGRPFNSWPAFIPVTFEMTILFSALCGVLGMLALNGLPRPHHPLFAIEQFDRATVDKFFLLILARDPQFHPAKTRSFLESLGAEEVIDVPA
jgi:hypothetical protein